MPLNNFYKEIGLKVGLEIHRQLNTKTKLFCNCPTEEINEGKEIRFVRRLREAQSEMGSVDPAAQFEARKRKLIVYHARTGNVCLVEMDEEPPHELNPEALRIALTAALMMDAEPVDEIHVMRKIVVDGSNTTGFQRTCIVAIGGRVKVREKVIPIQTITLEEDAAKLISYEKGVVHYDLSRLGIPLIEVSTAPVIETPKEAVEVAYAIGRILRATRGVKRGIGTVRQDLNISIRGGAPIEVKGVQELELIEKVIENEVKRQLHLLKISEELRKRNVMEEDIINAKPIDVTEIFLNTACKIIKHQIEKGNKVYAIVLKGFAGLLGLEAAPGIKLGAEIAGRVKAWTDIEGILHTDELPAYGISMDEVVKLKEVMKIDDRDAAVIVASEKDRALDAIEVIKQRAIEAIKGIPEETRAARPDGTTVYMRPRPGSARMYPETDIPPIPIEKDYIEMLRKNLPPSLDEVEEDLVKRYGLSKQLARQLVDKEVVEDFEEIVSATKASPSIVATALTELMVSLKREGLNVDRITKNHVKRFFELAQEGKVAKEALKDVLILIARENISVEEAISKLNLWAPSKEDVESTIRRLMESFKEDILIDRERTISKLMGELMKIYRGRVDGAKLNEMLRRYIEENIR